MAILKLILMEIIGLIALNGYDSIPWYTTETRTMLSLQGRHAFDTNQRPKPSELSRVRNEQFSYISSKWHPRINAREGYFHIFNNISQQHRRIKTNIFTRKDICETIMVHTSIIQKHILSEISWVRDQLFDPVLFQFYSNRPPHIHVGGRVFLYMQLLIVRI